VDGREMVHLGSNNYLGLANDPAVKRAAAEAIERWGVGSGASRLITGTSGPVEALERDLAAFKGVEAAVVTSTGWQANASALAVLAGPGDLILSDKLNHASILDGAKASGAVLRTYRHGDVERLRALLERLRPRHRRCVIVTDGLFSMDGDVAPLAELAALKRQYDAILVVDDAHATGVLGDGGRGSAEAAGVADDVDVTVGTLSKALGSLGGFVTGPRALIETIVNRARPFIYTTALPAAMAAAARESLRIVREEPQRRRTCLALAGRLREDLRAAGFDTGASTTQIIPVHLGSAARAVEVFGRCAEAGLLVPAIRPPTVAPGTSRLRISVMATHDWDDLAALPDVLGGA
ncbi:MAG: 8-amino-7-oxononanoate synthase, partial [Planctomycetes bacterium]|nr:8-amino-7-oxononanoate synthase [Planctomycetota bacterium]